LSTVGAMIEDTRGHLYGFQKAQLNRLLDPMDTVIGTVGLEFTVDLVARNSVVCVDDELMYVWSTSGSSLTVQRGYLGTTAAPHAVGSLVEINPRFATPQIRNELRKEIASWQPRIFKVIEEEISVGTNTRTLDLENAPADFLHVLRVRRASAGGELTPRRVDFRVERLYGDYASGAALILTETVALATTLSVLYAVPFDLSDFSDDVNLVADVGVPDSALDIPSVGAAWRLLSTREIPRTNIDTAPEPRVAADVPAGHIIQAARQLKALRDERIGDEGRLLLHRYGVRMQ
jgi:hypothetical protein